MKKKVNKKGFTLIELLAVIIILGVLLLLAIPAVSRYIDESRKDTYASTVKSIIGAVSTSLNNMEYPFNLGKNEGIIVPFSEANLEKSAAKTKSPYAPYISDKAYVLAYFDGDNFLYYAVNTDRELLYQRIDQRIDQMMEDGLVEEVRALKAAGIKRGMTSMQGLGYKEILDYLDGKTSLEEAVYILKRDTRHFAKRQLTWFRREKEVRWLYLPDFDNDPDRVVEKIRQDCLDQKIL